MNQYQVRTLLARLLKTIPRTSLEGMTMTCELTGITLTINIPKIEGYSLTYTNPLAYSANFLPLSILPHSSLRSLGSSILAGLLLAALKRFSLLAESPISLTSVEQNLLLQELKAEKLIDLFKFFSSLTKKQALLIPQLFLSTKDSNEAQLSTVKHVMDSYLKACKDLLYPVYHPKADEIEALTNRAEALILGKLSSKNLIIQRAVKEAAKTRTALQDDAIARGRKITKDLALSSNLSDKLVHFIKILFQGDTLLTTEDSVKDKIATALQKHGGDILALELARIIKNPIMTLEKESIFPAPEVKAQQEEVQAALVIATEKKLSLKERIALIKARQHAESIKES